MWSYKESGIFNKPQRTGHTGPILPDLRAGFARARLPARWTGISWRNMFQWSGRGETWLLRNRICSKLAIQEFRFPGSARLGARGTCCKGPNGPFVSFPSLKKRCTGGTPGSEAATSWADRVQRSWVYTSCARGSSWGRRDTVFRRPLMQWIPSQVTW